MNSELQTEPTVIISLPWIYPNVDESKPGNSQRNLRIIPYSTLSKIIHYMLKVESDPDGNQFSSLESLVDLIIDDDPKQADLFGVLVETFQKYKLSKVETFYQDFSMTPINFDVIRTYHTDELGILVSATPLDPPSLYSQKSDKTCMDLRIEHRDTDFNRLQYALSEFEKTLLFRPGRMYNYTSKLINLVLVYYILTLKSKPWGSTSRAELGDHYNAFMLDVLLRSRILNTWHTIPERQVLLSDYLKNHDSKNLFVRLSGLPSSRDRFNLIRAEAKGEWEDFTWNYYMSLLGKHKLKIEGQDYWNLNAAVFTELTSTSAVKFLLSMGEGQSRALIQQMKDLTHEDQPEVTAELEKWLSEPTRPITYSTTALKRKMIQDTDLSSLRTKHPKL